MAFKLAEAFVQLSAHGLESVSAQINGLRGGLTRLGSVSLDGAMSATSRLGSALGGLKSAATGLPAVLGAVGGVALGKRMVDLAMDMEQATVSFKVMLGSAEAAKKLMAEIMHFAAVTPYESPEIVNATKSLIAFGSSASTVIDEVRRLGDIASGVGMPIGELAQIYGKARVQGRLFAEDINQLTGRGIPIIGEIAKQLGISQSEVRKAVEKGRVNFDTIATAFATLTNEGGRFHGMMEEQAKTMAGIASTARDDLNSALRDTGKLASEVLIPKFAEMAKQVAYWSDAIFHANEAMQDTPKPGTSQATMENISLDQMDVNTASATQLQAMRDKQAGMLKDVKKNWMDATDSIQGRNWFDSFGILADRDKMDEAEASWKALEFSLSIIDARLNRLKRDGQQAADEGIKKPMREAGQAIRQTAATINGAVNSMRNANQKAFDRSFGPQFKVSPGQLGYKDVKLRYDSDKASAEAAAKATQDYRARVKQLDHDLQQGTVTQQQYDQKLKQAQDTLNAASPKHAVAAATAEYESLVKQLDDRLQNGLINQQEHDKRAKEAKAKLDAAKAKASQPQYLSGKQYVAKATEEYERRVRQLDKSLKRGTISQQTHDEQAKEAKAKLDAAKAKASQPQYLSGKQYEAAARDEFQREMIRITTLMRMNKMTAAEAKQAGDNARKTLQKHLDEIKQMVAKAQRHSVSASGAWAGLLGTNAAELAMQAHQRQVAKANAVSDEAKKLYDESLNPTERYRKRMDELDKMRRDKNGISLETYNRLKKKADDELAEAMGEQKPQFHTKEGQIGEEEEEHKKRLAELEKQKPKLGDERYRQMRDRLEASHANRLEDIKEQHRDRKESPRFEHMDLSGFAKHIQESLYKNPADTRREQREKQMLTEMQKLVKNTDPRNQKNRPAVFAKGN